MKSHFQDTSSPPSYITPRHYLACVMFLLNFIISLVFLFILASTFFKTKSGKVFNPIPDYTHVHVAQKKFQCDISLLFIFQCVFS